MINKIPTITFMNYELDTLMKGVAMEQVKSVVFDKFYPNLVLAVNKNKKECVFCYVKDYQVIVPKDQYKPSLATLEKYYVSKEDWTKSAVLRDLQKTL